MFTRTAGTLAFAAPERLTENCIYNEKVDMWASGIVLFMLLVESHPTFRANYVRLRGGKIGFGKV